MGLPVSLRQSQSAVAAEPRLLPFNIDAEQALIGAVLLNNDAYRKVSNLVEAGHFMEEVHRRIWQATAGLIESGRIATPIMLKTYLGDADLGGGVTPMKYLAGLASAATTVVNAPDYARTVRDLALRRRLITVGEHLLDIAYEAPVDATAETIFSDLEREFEAVRPSMTGEESDFQDFGRISSDDVYETYRQQRGIVGLSTGLPRLDDVLGGLQPTDLIVIAGRPGSGKTALSTNIAVAVSRHVMARVAAGERLGVVGFSSLEMGKQQLKQRVLSDLASVPFWKLKRGIADEHEMLRYADADRDFERLPLLIDPTGALSIAQLKIRVRALKKRRGLCLLIVDYLQLLTGTGRKDNRVAEVTEITAGLKALAKELEIPIIALSQLSRKVEERDDKRPRLSDLRESGSIEQDADSVLFVYREEYYLKKAEPRQQGSEQHTRWQAQMRKWAGVAEIIVAKNRHGNEGVAELGFEGQYTRFSNEPAEREIEPEEVRERAAKKPTLPKDAAVLWGILKSLTITRSAIATQDQRAKDKKLCRGSRMVALDEARDAFGKEVMPTDTVEKRNSTFQKAFLALRNAGIAFYHAPPDDPIMLWLPELVADV